MKFIIFTVLLCGCAAKQLSFKDCGSVGAKISSVNVPECETDPCILHRGTNYTVMVDYDALENTASAKTVVHGIIGGLPVPFPVPSDCCNNHQLKCPVVKSTTGTYKNSIYCSPNYPKIRLVAKWEVIDDNNNDFFCFVLPLEIQD